MKVLMVEAAAAAGQTLLTTDVVDMQGFDSVAFIAVLGDVTDTSALVLTGFTNDTNDTASPTQLAKPVSFTAGASDADNKMLFLSSTSRASVMCMPPWLAALPTPL